MEIQHGVWRMRLGILAEENCLFVQLYLVVWVRRNLRRDRVRKSIVNTFECKESAINWSIFINQVKVFYNWKN